MTDLRIINGRIVTGTEPAVLAEGRRAIAELVDSCRAAGIPPKVTMTALTAMGLTEPEAGELICEIRDHRVPEPCFQCGGAGGIITSNGPARCHRCDGDFYARLRFAHCEP
jgi:hypothetical protein